MAPGSNERHPPPPPHTGTVPKTKVRNCVVPQEAVTPTRRDMNSSNLVAGSLDWVPVPVSEYNSRANYTQSSRKTTNHSHTSHTAEHDFSDLDNSLSLESALQRFVPVRPQPRGPPAMQPPADHSDDSLHHYHQPATANGVSPHANHAAAAIMIVNPTTPNTVTGNMSQPYNVPANTTRNNLARAFHWARSGADSGSSSNLPASQQAPAALAGGRTATTTKPNNINSNVYEPAQPAFTHRADSNHRSGGGAGECARALGEAMVSSCPDAAAVERRLGQIREYIRVTSSLVDTMRNSEDEAYIEHTKEEYDELVQMVMQLKESETKLVKLLEGTAPENNEVLSDNEEGIVENDRPKSTNPFVEDHELATVATETVDEPDKTSNSSVPESGPVNNFSVTDSDTVNPETVQQTLSSENKVKMNTEITLTLVKKVSNIENEQLNKSNDRLNHSESMACPDVVSLPSSDNVTDENTDKTVTEIARKVTLEHDASLDDITNSKGLEVIEITEIQTESLDGTKSDEELNELLRQNIMSCNEKLAEIQVLKEAKNKEEGCELGGERAMKFCKLLDRLALTGSDAEVHTTNSLPRAPTNHHEAAGGGGAGGARPTSAQSNGSGYSDNELWQSELKAKMEVSQQRLAALQDQQKRLLKYQAEAKQQLAEMHNMNRSRQSLESLPPHPAAALDPHAAHAQNQLFAPNQQQSVRMYNSNQIGVATTLPHANHANHVNHANHANHVNHSNHAAHHHNTGELNVSSGSAPESYGAAADVERPDSRHHDDRFTLRNTNSVLHVEGVGMRAQADGGGSEEEEGDEEVQELSPHGRELQHKLRDLQRKKQHMENLVAEFQKLQAEERLLGGGGGGKAAARAHNTYSSDDSGAEEEAPPHKCNKSDANMNKNNEDPFKLMEISAIKAALQKTKDLMRSVERYEPHDSGVNDDSFQLTASHSNINDNKSEGGGSGGDWSTEGSVCRSIHNAIQPAGKLTNHTQPHQSSAHGGGARSPPARAGTEASISSLHLLAQQLRQEAESISSERRRLKHSLSRNKEGGGKLSQKKVNAELGAAESGSAGLSPGPLERTQAALRAELADKQRQLHMILNNEKDLSSSSSVQKMKADSCSYSAMNQSYNSEQEEGGSHTDEVMFSAHAQPHHHHHYPSAEGSVYGESGMSALPPHLQPAASSNYCSDSDTGGSRGRGDARSTRSRRNRAAPPERAPHEHQGAGAGGSACGSALAEPPPAPPPPAPPPHHAPRAQVQGESSGSAASYPPPPAPPPAWTNKSNQDARTNQFTQNSHSQTMERLLGSQQVPFPPSVPFNMMMPYGVMGGGACGCAWWGPWCWQQLTAQQRQIHELRDQINSLEERWRSDAAPHALNNQVAPGNRANNYWDNFRSYSRQNLLSANSKTNADGHLGSVPPHNPHPLVERSHNTLHPAPAPLVPAPAPTPPATTPKRNSNAQHSLPSAPDVLNVNQHADPDTSHAHLNRDRAHTVPEIVQAHSNNLNRPPDSFNTKKKSSSKLPAKNSANRRNYSLDFVQNSNINIASTSEAPNPNLASTSRDNSRDKATSKLFDLLRENVYSEVTALISANESHPDFLIQLFRDLQRVSSDSLRQNALRSIRDLLSHNIVAGPGGSAASLDTPSGETDGARNAAEEISSTDSHLDAGVRDGAAVIYRDIIDFMIARGEEICTPDLLETFKSVIIDSHRDAGHPMPYSQKRLQEFLSKYEGMRLREVSGDIIEDLMSVPSVGEQEELARQQSDVSEASILQDVAGSLNIFSSSDSQLHQLAAAWGGGEAEAERERLEGKVDLVECTEMYNGDLAEADQTCPAEAEAAAHDAPELLPDLVETDEATPTEAEAEWLGLDRVPTRLHTEDSPANQKD